MKYFIRCNAWRSSKIEQGMIDLVALIKQYSCPGMSASAVTLSIDETTSTNVELSLIELYTLYNILQSTPDIPTDLLYVSSPTNGTITSSNGTDAILPLADNTNAGLMSPAQFTQFEELPDDLLLKADLIDGLVPANQLPSYVDDVLEGTYIDSTTFDDLSAIPYTPESSKIYVDTTSNITYRWSGSVYVEISTTNIPTFQQVTDVGNVTTNSISVNNPSDSRGVGLSTLGRIGVSNIGGFISSIRATNLTESCIQELPNLGGTYALISQTITNGNTSTSPSEDAVFDFVTSKVNEYNTYFVNATTGNNTTGVFQDAMKPFATIDYVVALPAFKEGDIIYLQGTGLTYPMNGKFKGVSQLITADVNSTNILDFSNNLNVEVVGVGVSFSLISINMPNGKIRNERSGGSGVQFYSNTVSVGIDFNVKEIYWNTNIAMTSGAVTDSKLKADIISSNVNLLSFLSNDITIHTYTCLGASYLSANDTGKNITINNINGVGSYYFLAGRYFIGDISTIQTSYTISNLTNITFRNSIIGNGGFGLGSDAVIQGVVKSATIFKPQRNTGANIKYVNFVADLGTAQFPIDLSDNLIFENCSIKTTNSPFGNFLVPTATGSLKIKNSTFEVVNSVPLITGGAGGTRTVTIDGLTHNATMISDQEGNGVTVNVIGKAVVANGVNPKDAVNLGQLNAASPLATLDEGNGNGIVRAGRTAANYGNVGLNAIDLGFSDDPALYGATGATSVVSGGIYNKASGIQSTVGGGYNNSATNTYATISGGRDNTSSGNAATIGGGTGNTASSSRTTVAGGVSNVATAEYATIGGGYANTTSGYASTVGGGEENIGSGNDSTVSGGKNMFARSFGEWVGGLFGTDYTPTGASTWSALDRIFNIGNGTGTGARSDAFTVLKNGTAIHGGVVRLKNYTVATLPTGVEGDTAYVTDATAPTYLGTLTGGGTVKCPVFFNGTSWVSC